MAHNAVSLCDHLLDIEAQIGEAHKPARYVFLHCLRPTGGRFGKDARAKLMGHAILRKDLVRKVESASVPQFLNESFDDVFCWLHSRAPYSNFNLSQRCQGRSIESAFSGQDVSCR